MKNSIAIAIVLSVLVAVNCKKEQQASNEAKGYIVFLKGDVWVNEKEAKLRQQVKQSDFIKTGKKAAASIQFAESAVVKLKASTSLEISRLVMGDDKPEINLTQKSGSTFNKIVKGKANYNLSTPTAVAGVRGTSFSVKVSKGRTTTVELLQGSVEVQTTDKDSATAKQPVLLEEGKKVTIEEVKATGEIKVSEVVELAAPEVQDLSEDNSTVEVMTEPQIEQFVKEDVAASEEKKEEIKKEEVKPLTEADLKAKYGRLSKIILKSGKTYIGAFQQKGGEMIIITVEGRFVHKPSEIEKVLPHN